MVNNFFPRNFAATLTDVYAKFKFVINLMNFGRFECEFAWVIGDGRPRLAEDDRRGGYLRATHFFDMLEIIFPDAENLWEDFKSVQLIGHLFL
jgi:hypothetical protein